MLSAGLRHDRQRGVDFWSNSSNWFGSMACGYRLPDQSRPSASDSISVLLHCWLACSRVLRSSRLHDWFQQYDATTVHWSNTLSLYSTAISGLNREQSVFPATDSHPCSANVRRWRQSTYSSPATRCNQRPGRSLTGSTQHCCPSGCCRVEVAIGAVVRQRHKSSGDRPTSFFLPSRKRGILRFPELHDPLRSQKP